MYLKKISLKKEKKNLSKGKKNLLKPNFCEVFLK